MISLAALAPTLKAQDALTVVPGCALAGRSKVTETSGINGVTTALTGLLAVVLSGMELSEAPAVTVTGVVPTKTLTVRVKVPLGPTVTVSVVVTPPTG